MADRVALSVQFRYKRAKTSRITVLNIRKLYLYFEQPVSLKYDAPTTPGNSPNRSNEELQETTITFLTTMSKTVQFDSPVSSPLPFFSLHIAFFIRDIFIFRWNLTDSSKVYRQQQFAWVRLTITVIRGFDVCVLRPHFSQTSRPIIHFIISCCSFYNSAVSVGILFIYSKYHSSSANSLLGSRCMTMNTSPNTRAWQWILHQTRVHDNEYFTKHACMTMNTSPNMRAWQWILHQTCVHDNEYFTKHACMTMNTSPNTRAWQWILHQTCVHDNEYFTKHACMTMNTSPNMRAWQWILHQTCVHDNEYFTKHACMTMNTSPNMRAWQWILHQTRVHDNEYFAKHACMTMNTSPNTRVISSRTVLIPIRLIQ